MALHLTLAGLNWMSCWSASPALKNGLLSWHPKLANEAQALTKALSEYSDTDFYTALGTAIQQRMGGLAAGIDAYCDHPVKRDLEDPDVFRTYGHSRVLDFGALLAPGQRGKKPVLLVPSLVNRGYILDLCAHRSFARTAAEHGFHVYLVDWGDPGKEEENFTLSDYAGRRLVNMAVDVKTASAGELQGLGFCMGGNLILGAAVVNPGLFKSLVFLGTPWNFHAEGQDIPRRMAAYYELIAPLCEEQGHMPVDILQSFFAGLDPMLTIRKFIGFAGMDSDSDKARDFVILEDWVNDGMPLALEVARESILEWYGENTPHKGMWRINGKAVRPQKMNIPSLVVAPSNDRIVPPDSALALARQLPDAEVFQPAFGHVGLIASSKAPSQVWPRIFAWWDEFAL